MALAQSRLDQIRDLVNQFEQLAGFSITVNDAEVEELANEKAETLFEVGQYFARDSRNADTFRWAPWASYGMSAVQYTAKLATLDSAFMGLTGQSLPSDILDRALKQTLGEITGPEFNTWLLSQESVKNTYGWLRYGLDFEQFQARKLEMRTQFGRDLSDAEAATQLRYAHAAQGPNVSASVAPTLTQQEKKQANVGIGQSVVR